MVPSTAVAEDSVAVLGCRWMLKLGHDAGAKRDLAGGVVSLTVEDIEEAIGLFLFYQEEAMVDGWPMSLRLKMMAMELLELGSGCRAEKGRAALAGCGRAAGQGRCCHCRCQRCFA
ncbi:hypothetical protein OIU74_006706 [Salix koriyanagi]|uniref:Uncharacterized protein n=1 Tax=Salix koriyanagi TaxID=2511006 RepID=A0A9Q0UF13_9ROSI|nr:hypothetical protein OIU74_006706 [Salix koriyanagi]